MRPVLALFAGFAILAVLLAWSRRLSGRRWAALGHLAAATALAAVAGLGWPLADFVDDFEPSVAERPLAEIYFERIGPNRYRAALTRLPSGRMQMMELSGDEWRLTLRTLEWSQPAAELGSRERHLLETLESRQAPMAAAGVPLRSAHSLGGPVRGLPALGRAEIGGRPLLATREVDGPWMPMNPGARFDLRLTGAGTMQVDPLNPAADEALAAR